ncbi:MAG: hypothetical protein EBT03_08035 [Betaproteobacteria bacterium]|nr:hypothetical protein [Betaproteobacteria bacterium]
MSDAKRERLVGELAATKSLLHACDLVFKKADSNRLMAFREMVVAEKALADYDAQQPRGGEGGVNG